MDFLDEYENNAEILEKLQSLKFVVNVESYPNLVSVEKDFRNILARITNLEAFFYANSLLANELVEVRTIIHQIEEQFNGIYSIIGTPLIDNLLNVFNEVCKNAVQVVQSKAIKLYMDLNNRGNCEETHYPTYFLDENSIFNLVCKMRPFLEPQTSPPKRELDICTFFNTLLRLISSLLKSIIPNQFYVKQTRVMVIWEKFIKEIPIKMLSLQKIEYLRNSRVHVTSAIKAIDALFDLGEIDPDKKIKIKGVFGYRDEVKLIATFINYVKSYKIDSDTGQTSREG